MERSLLAVEVIPSGSISVDYGLGRARRNIANELRHQYNIFYRPEPLKTDGSYQTVSVKIKGRKDLVVRARKGYYAPKF